MKNPVFLLLLALAALISCDNFRQSTSEESPEVTSEPPAQNQNPISATGQKAPLSDTEKNAVTLLKRGLELIQAQKYEEGVDYLNRALEADPDNERALFNRGFGYYSLKNYDLAQEDFNQALRLNPADTMALLYSGLTRFFKGDYPGAVQDYTNAILKSKGFSLAYYNRGIARGQHLKDYRGSLEDFNKAIQLNGNYAEAFYNRGIVNLLLRDTVNACKDWEDAKMMGSFKAQEALKIYCEGR
jgi:tetratricopeptide (TPR) repeat protein